MKALRVHSYDPGSAIQVDEVPVPEPEAGEVRVQVEAFGVSFVDLLVARGGYQVKLPLPLVPGSEFSGTVDAISPGTATSLRVGDKVCGTRQSVWARYICLPAQSLYLLPASASATEGAVVLAAYFTALYALRERGALRSGETLLVLGAGGGVGHAAVQIGKVLGARVIAAASTEDKRQAARQAGADHTVDTSKPDWRVSELKALAPQGVDVVYDPIGGDTTDAAFRALGWNGRLLMVGFAAGQIGLLKTNLAIVKGASLIGVDARQFSEREGDSAHRVRREVIQLYVDGRIRPLVSHVLPLDRFGEAEVLMSDRATYGRVVVTF